MTITQSKERSILEAFENNSSFSQPKKVVERDITELPLSEIAVILEFQERLNRRWQIKRLI